MKLFRLFVVVVLALAGQAIRAEAQVAEISAGLSRAEVTEGGDFAFTSLRSPAVDLRTTVRLSDRFSIEPVFTYGRRSIAAKEYSPFAVGGDTERTEGTYGVILHQRLTGLTRPGFEGYLSYGLNGLYFTERVPERRIVYSRSEVVTLPGWTRRENDGMFFPTVGFGVRKSVGRHLAVRADAEVVSFLIIPVGMRASVGMVVPLGGRR